MLIIVILKMMTIIFKNDVKGIYEDYVKYFYGTIKNYLELFPNTDMSLSEFTKEEFEDIVKKSEENLNKDAKNTLRNLCKEFVYEKLKE